MKTETINVYKFDELSEEAKETAINEFRDINVSYNWWEFTYEDAKEIGLKITGFDLDRNKHATGELILSACEVAQNIFNNHGENCETYKSAEKFMQDWQPVFNEAMTEPENLSELEEKLIDLEQEFEQELLEDYATILQNECDYLMSDEAVIEAIEANEYDFLESGKPY